MPAPARYFVVDHILLLTLPYKSCLIVSPFPALEKNVMPSQSLRLRHSFSNLDTTSPQVHKTINTLSSDGSVSSSIWSEYKRMLARASRLQTVRIYISLNLLFPNGQHCRPDSYPWRALPKLCRFAWHGLWCMHYASPPLRRHI